MLNQPTIEKMQVMKMSAMVEALEQQLASNSWTELGFEDRLGMTGRTGTGKTYLACALANKACRLGLTAYYVRASQLPQELAIARGDGTYLRLLKRITRTNLLVIDDWLLTPLTDAERRDILEVIEDRHERTSTLIASQLPVAAWHEALGEPTVADSICDRLIHAAHKIQLDGPSMRAVRAAQRKAGDSR